MARHRANFLAVLAALAALTTGGARAAEPLASYTVEVDQTSVSGVSSGAYMAGQFHIAFSDRVTGAGLIAGGPYFCAEASVSTALSRCMKTVLGEPDPARLFGLSQDLAPKRIRANVVSPGTIYFDDGIWGRVKRDNPEWFARALANNPLGRMGTPEDIAAAVTYISSPRASFVTGANLVVDGGFTRRVY